MIKIDCAFDEMVPLEKLVPHPRNNNVHSIAQIEALAKLMNAHGFRYPIVVSNRSGFVVSGHGRLEALRLLKEETAPVDYQNYESEAEEYQVLTSDNEIARWAELDYASIYKSINEIPEIDTSLLGIPNFKLPEIIDPGPSGADHVGELPIQPKTKKGDIWILGRHRLMCGDSTLLDNVEALMDKCKADMGFCDPPYNLGFSYNSYDDNKSDDEYIEFSHLWFTNLQMVTDRQLVTMGTKNIQIMANLAEKIAGVGCWVKKNWITSCHIAKLQQWEPIFFYGDFTKLKRTSDLFEINRKEQKDVGDQHTCPKQIELINDLLIHYCLESVVDLFGGSGTTLISAELNKKSAFLMEQDAKYCDVIINRWEGLTGLKAVLEATGETYEQVSRY